MDSRICVNGLPPRLYNEKELRKIFAGCGTITDIQLPALNQGKPTGLAFVGFDSASDAEKAVKQKNNTFHGTVKLKVNIAKPQPDRKRPGSDSTRDGQDAETSEPAAKRNLPYVPKSSENHGSKSWNALFLGGDVVADIFSQKLSIEKSALLAGSKELPAVTAMAIAEMKVLKEVRTFLLENGVNIFSFANDERSTKCLLLKNLAPGLSIDQLRKTFAACGKIEKLIFNEDMGMTAILEYANGESAAKAFDRMNGTMYKRRPLKMEFAPVSVFSKPPNRELFGCEMVVRLVKLVKDWVREGNQASMDVYDILKSTALVTFSNRSIMEYDFRILFPNLKSKILGAGLMADQSPLVGFVLFDSPATALTAMEARTACITRDEILSIAIANEQTVIAGERSAKKTLVVRNLPFTVKESELLPLMKAAGEVKELRLPQSVTGTKRGFGFVEYVDAGDVQKAMDMFDGVHFAGRRMVLEISRVKETVKEARMLKKSKKHVTKKDLSAAISESRNA